MTDGIDPVGLSTAREQLDELCTKVGLVRAEDLPRPATALQPPEGTTLWFSSYARLLLWPCGASESTSVDQAAAVGQAWFDELLVQSERSMRGRPIDGYLVLALPQAPDPQALEDIRRLELSAQVCRKHLIWPSSANDVDHEAGRWRRVADVTVLGLPDAAAAPGPELRWPDLDTEAQALWTELASIGVSEAILRHEEAT
ncbi:hypothetical protein [Achromobacter pestifer]|uniref:Uncharacterized protein n=1 Tax=Achromobacter pestifer TaxID=1353889 RepID=A0A6S6YVQ9_9BURK|nr:hypothetical protein [Achromobacter pestifer]CAB3647373.1 hypothetical protein LMG3431_02563 [Achromobacter pestifer]